jgi:hypothetical protein
VIATTKRVKLIVSVLDLRNEQKYTIQTTGICHEAQCMFDVILQVIRAASHSGHDDDSSFLVDGHFTMQKRLGFEWTRTWP